MYSIKKITQILNNRGEWRIMKKRILAALCAAVLTLALPLTAMAAPSASDNYAALPSAEGKVLATYTQAKVEVVASTDATAASVKVGTVNKAFMPGVLSAISECFGNNSVVYDVSRIAVKKNGNLTLKCNLASAQDTIKVLFYNKVTGLWDVRVATVADGILSVADVTADHTFYIIVK